MLYKYILVVLNIILLLGNFVYASPIDSVVNELPRPSAKWEQGFYQRKANMYGPYVAGYNPNPNTGVDDGGKSEWPKLLSRLAWPTTNSTTTQLTTLLSQGQQMINGPNVGSFYKPFSCAGYALYYFKWKDSIAKYYPAQITSARNDVKNMINLLMRQDHVFDECCSYNIYGGKEFNSENFHWMMRSAGFLFAHELQSSGAYNMTSFTPSSIQINTGLSSPRTKYINPTNLNVINYFNGWLNNLTRALYCAGRVEWNSNNYYGHTVNPLIALYDGIDNCGDPNLAEDKKKAQALLDWMMVEAAIRYQDGFQAAADARAKQSSFAPFKGSVYPYTYAFFADSNFHPTFDPHVWLEHEPGVSESGFLLSTSYRPPQVVIDLAQRKFNMPVEIQSAKPFYHIDKGVYFNNNGIVTGNAPYTDWRGTKNGRRFEFETIYIDRNVTLASAAVGRPSGNIGTFAEQCSWRLAYTGQNYGARMLSGNGGGRSTTSGRDPRWQVGQFRNMMMQMVKSTSSSSNNIWFVVPDTALQLQTTGEAAFYNGTQYYKWIGSKLFLDLGNQVYLAIIPSSGATKSVANSGEASGHRMVKFSWPANQLGAVVFEVGTQNQFSSFTDFVTQRSNADITTVSANTYKYTGHANNDITMEYTPLTTFLMYSYTYDTPNPNPQPNMGNYPKVWGNGNFIDYQTWDSYRTVLGDSVLNQKWGSGIMTINTLNNNGKITVDTTTSNVTFSVRKKDLTPTFLQKKNNDTGELNVFPNPNSDIFTFQSKKAMNSIWMFDVKGVLVHENNNVNTNELTLNLSKLVEGIYIVKAKLTDGTVESVKIKIDK